VSGGHLAWTDAGVAVTGTFMGRDTEAGLAYVKDHGQPRQLTQPADLRGQLAAVAPGFAITITYVGSRAAGKCSGLPRV
jgi:hypothetical protein